LYLYEIKIQIDINQNGVEKYAGKSQFLQKYIIIIIIIIIILKWNWTGPDPTQLCELGLYWPSYKAGLSPAAWSGLMFQPKTNKSAHSNQPKYN
jgi:hypothetical protein